MHRQNAPFGDLRMLSKATPILKDHNNFLTNQVTKQNLHTAVCILRGGPDESRSVAREHEHSLIITLSQPTLVRHSQAPFGLNVQE